MIAQCFWERGVWAETSKCGFILSGLWPCVCTRGSSQVSSWLPVPALWASLLMLRAAVGSVGSQQPVPAQTRVPPTPAAHSWAVFCVLPSLLPRLWQGSLKGLPTWGSGSRCRYCPWVKAKSFCLGTQITLDVGASAFPLLKATCAPGSAGDGMEMSPAVCFASAAEWRWWEAGVWAIAYKIAPLQVCFLRKEHWFYYYHMSKLLCFHITMNLCLPQNNQRVSNTNLYLGR